MAIYAYADETIFTINNKSGDIALGSGMLICQSEITRQTIEEAIIHLKEDKDFDLKKDLRTLQRGYFHASDDSKNAHSHFCRAINKNISGVFDYSYFDNITQANITQKGFADKTFDRCLSQSTLELFLSTDEVFLIIEKRDSINETTASKWLSSLYKLYEDATYNLPSYKTFYPKINISFGNKSDPGLQ